MIHERVLTILLHFLVRFPERLNFTILHLISMCTYGSKKEPLPNVNILF
jgi:hypothetical protein